MHVHAPLEAVMTRNWVTERHKEYTAPVGGQWPRQPGLCKERGVRMRGRTGQDSGCQTAWRPVSAGGHTLKLPSTLVCAAAWAWPRHRGHCRLFKCSHTMIIKYHRRYECTGIIEDNSVESYVL